MPVQVPAVSPVQVGVGGKLQVCVPLNCCRAATRLLLMLHQITLSFW